jgi:hypothetical protein
MSSTKYYSLKNSRSLVEKKGHASFGAEGSEPFSRFLVFRIHQQQLDSKHVGTFLSLEIEIPKRYLRYALSGQWSIGA